MDSCIFKITNDDHIHNLLRRNILTLKKNINLVRRQDLRV